MSAYVKSLAYLSVTGGKLCHYTVPVMVHVYGWWLCISFSWFKPEL